MPFFEFLMGFSAIVILPSIVLSFIKDIKKEKYKALAASGAASEGLRASELKRIIEDAVADAVEPLELQIEDLEAALRDSGAITTEKRLDADVVKQALADEVGSIDDEIRAPARARA